MLHPPPRPHRRNRSQRKPAHESPDVHQVRHRALDHAAVPGRQAEAGEGWQAQAEGIKGVRTRGRSLRLVRLYHEQRGICYLCGGRMTLDLDEGHTATIEHVIPRSRGGGKPDGPRNRRAACFDCNQDKGSQTPQEMWERYIDEVNPE